nr:aldo/keto reductase [Acidimicrobiia bacterium]
YKGGIPDDSRGALKGYDWLAESLRNPEALERVERLRPIAEKLDCTMAQLALAWCAKNPNVSTVITGASRPAQVAENFEALDVIDLLDEDVMSSIEAAVA